MFFQNWFTSKNHEKKEHLLKRLERTGKIGYWHVDVKNHNKVTWSDEVYRIHGVDPFNFQPNVENAIQAYHPDDQEYVREVVSDAIEYKNNFRFDLRIIRPSGELRHVASFGECDLDKKGNVIALFGVFQDITDAKKREKKARDSEEFLKLMMDKIPDLIFVKDCNFRIVDANKAFFELYPGKHKDDIIGSTTIEEYDPEEAQAFVAHDKQALETGFSITQETVKLPDGIVRTLLTTKTRFENHDGEKFILGVGRDIGDILALQQTHESIVETMVDGLIVIDEKGTIETYNNACEDIFGYSAMDVIGLNVSMLMPEKYAQAHDLNIQHYIETQQSKIIGVGRELEGKRKDGSVFPMHLSIADVKAPGKRLFSGIIRDLSTIKDQEDVT